MELPAGEFRGFEMPATDEGEGGGQCRMLRAGFRSPGPRFAWLIPGKESPFPAAGLSWFPVSQLENGLDMMSQNRKELTAIMPEFTPPEVVSRSARRPIMDHPPSVAPENRIDGRTV